MNPVQSSDYQSYLIRFWRQEPATPWQAAVQNVSDGTLSHFRSASELCAFLQTKLSGEAEADSFFRYQPE